MEQVYNPYLPLTSYIPDGEPHVFGGRLYIYGSHDRAGGLEYCEGHYEVWSAPVDDLRDWRREGVSYLRTQDPSNADDTMQLWAPDVTRGPDGKYYLYYCLGFNEEIGVAVSENPAGPFCFLGHVHWSEHVKGGRVLTEGFVFDPAVLTDDDGRVYLYYGFAPYGAKTMILPPMPPEAVACLPPALRNHYRPMEPLELGENAMVVELEPDMVTVKNEPRPLIPGGRHEAGTGFEGHGFFEASSIRKLDGRYYFVYSSHLSHELCYAVSDRPDRGFTYGGTLISNGDIGLHGRTEPVYPLGNNHGGLVRVGEETYIFYHRQTNGTEFSRQGCAEQVEIGPDGKIAQAEITSCGLNGGPLRASGTYPASIACHLTDPTVTGRIDYNDPVMKAQIRVTERQNVSFVTGIKDDSTVGYKYFQFDGPVTLLLELRGNFDGRVTISHDEGGENAVGGTALAPIPDSWGLYAVTIRPNPGKGALYLRFAGRGEAELKTLAFQPCAGRDTEE